MLRYFLLIGFFGAFQACFGQAYDIEVYNATPCQVGFYAAPANCVETELFSLAPSAVGQESVNFDPDVVRWYTNESGSLPSGSILVPPNCNGQEDCGITDFSGDCVTGATIVNCSTSSIYVSVYQ